MAHIKSISFESVGKREGCTCDRCGQYIQNIWTVEYREGLVVHYGIDCWQKVQDKGLNATGKKMMRKVMKSIQFYTEWLSKYTSGELTEENDVSYQTAQADWNKTDCWHGVPFDEYKKWMVEEFFPYRIAEAQKELIKFSKVNFEA